MIYPLKQGSGIPQAMTISAGARWFVSVHRVSVYFVSRLLPSRHLSTSCPHYGHLPPGKKGELKKELVNNWTGDCIPSSNWHMSCKAPFFAGHFAKPLKKPRCFYGVSMVSIYSPLHLATDDYTMRPGIKFETQKDGRNPASLDPYETL